MLSLLFIHIRNLWFFTYIKIFYQTNQKNTII